MSGLNDFGHAVTVIVGNDNFQSVRRRGRHVDVRVWCIVEGGTEHLSNITRKGLKLGRCFDKLATRYTARRNVEDFQRRTFCIDECLTTNVLCPGKSGYGQIAV